MNEVKMFDGVITSEAGMAGIRSDIPADEQGNYDSI